MKGHLKHFEISTPTWPLRDPHWEGAKLSKILSKYFLTYNDFKTNNNSFSSKWHLSTSSTTVFNFIYFKSWTSVSFLHLTIISDTCFIYWFLMRLTAVDIFYNWVSPYFAKLPQNKIIVLFRYKLFISTYNFASKFEFQ